MISTSNLVTSCKNTSLNLWCMKFVEIKQSTITRNLSASIESITLIYTVNNEYMVTLTNLEVMMKYVLPVIHVRENSFERVPITMTQNLQF